METVLVFSGRTYYPNGGISDFKGAFTGDDRLERATLRAEEIRENHGGYGEDWVDVVSLSGEQITILAQWVFKNAVWRLTDSSRIDR